MEEIKQYRYEVNDDDLLELLKDMLKSSAQDAYYRNGMYMNYPQHILLEAMIRLYEDKNKAE